MEERKTWEPTPEQMQHYKNIEIEHAKRNISFGLQSKGFSTTLDLLHSKATAHAAMQAVLAERPNRFARDPRRFSALPRDRKGT